MKKQWWKETTVYQIYPRSFLDTNGDGIGDLQGIVQKADYLRELGVGALWLCPVYASPQDDNGYDISNYRAISPEYGTMGDMETLVDVLHQRDIRLIMDLVVNHTSDEHLWFQEAKKSRDNPYRDYYIWRDPVDGGPPNNWRSRFSGPAWSLDEATGQYYLHLFSNKMPDLNWENPRVREEVCSIMRFWLDKGVDGFRMDVINMISKDPALPNIPGEGLQAADRHYVNGPHVHEYLQELHREVLGPAGAVTVGETKGVDPGTALLYVGEDRGELDMVFQFELDSIDMGPGGKWDIRPWTLAQLKQVMGKWQAQLHGKCWNSLFLENHDIPRSVSRFGDDGQYRGRSAKLLATLLFTAQGTPFIYQGQELAMANPGFDEIDSYRDVQTLNMFRDYTQNRGMGREAVLDILRYRSRDNARTPMRWANERNMGFTTGTPWISPGKEDASVNVKDQLADEDSVLSYYKKLIRLRGRCKALVYGTYRECFEADRQLYAYIREWEGEAVYVILNFSRKGAALRVPTEMDGADMELLLSNSGNSGVYMEPYECRVYIRQNQ